MALTTYTAGEVLTAASLNDNLAYAVTVPAAVPGGLVLISSGTVTAGASLSFDNCFSATYANYLIMLTHTGGNNPTIRLRASAADITAANYDLQGFYVTGTAQTITGSNSQTSWTVSNGAGYSQPYIVLGNPFAATKTSITCDYGRTDAAIFQQVGGRYNATTSADGFSILATTLTVTARVYGFANS